MTFLLIAHALAAVAAPAIVKVLGPRSFLVLAAVPAAAFGWLLRVAEQVRVTGAVSERRTWVPGLGLSLDLRLTTLSWVLALLVTGVGALVLFYCRWYFHEGDPTVWRFSAVFTAFAGAMLGLVLTDNLLVLYVFWEVTTVLSYLLIGHNPASATNRRAAMQALLVTTFGGLAMLIGIVGLGHEHGYQISTLLAGAASTGTLSGLTVASVVLLLVGALSKSALVPFHFWLPGAMAAPTPVSAYLHAAAMVKAGVYLVALFAPLFAGAPGWHLMTVGLGLATMLVGGWKALRQNDIKLLLAYGTVSQLGFMVAVAGLGTRESALAACLLVLAHGLFKSTLFLTVGVVDHQAGTRDLRALSGLWRPLMPLCVSAVLAGLSMAGVAPLLGFVSKEAALEALVSAAHEGTPIRSWGAWVALTAVVAGSALTVAYTARFLWGTFATKPGVAVTAVKAPAPGFVAAPVTLGVAGLVMGLVGGLLGPYLAPYVGQFRLGPAPASVSLWHGFTLPLALSLVSLTVGLVLFVYREPVAQLARRRVGPESEQVFASVMYLVDRSAVETTAVTQRGSLPLYLATIFGVFGLAVGAMAVQAPFPSSVTVWDSPAQLAVALVMVLAAVLSVMAHRRIGAVLLVGVTGYCASVFFLLHGAPDLAITQMLVETVGLVVFVLVLRRLPTRFAFTNPRRIQLMRGALAGLVGLVVALVALVSTAARRETPVSVEYAKEAYDFGSGKNIVNVTLVDIRAWDTLGEVSVLVAAATGIASLIFVRTRNTRISRARNKERRSTTGGTSTWLAGGKTLRRERRSVIFEVVTRLVFHIMLAASIYLLVSGHNQPGGGFAGGLVAGTALFVRYLAAGRYELDEAAPVDAGLLVGLGLLVCVAAALAPVAFGGVILQTYTWEFTLWPWGPVKLVTSLFFDIGLYLIVVGLMLDIVRSLGAGIDRQIVAEREERNAEHGERVGDENSEARS